MNRTDLIKNIARRNAEAEYDRDLSQDWEKPVITSAAISEGNEAVKMHGEGPMTNEEKETYKSAWQAHYRRQMRWTEDERREKRITDPQDTIA